MWEQVDGVLTEQQKEEYKALAAPWTDTSFWFLNAPSPLPAGANAYRHRGGAILTAPSWRFRSKEWMACWQHRTTAPTGSALRQRT